MSVHGLFSLDGRRALITGGGRGLGRALAIAFADAGAHVVICARREHMLRETAEIIDRGRGNGRGLVPTSRSRRHPRIREVAGDIDILVNNAACTRASRGRRSRSNRGTRSCRQPVRPVPAVPGLRPGDGRPRLGPGHQHRLGLRQHGPQAPPLPREWGPSSYFASKHGINGITHYLAPRLAPLRRDHQFASRRAGSSPRTSASGSTRTASSASRKAPSSRSEVMMGRAGDGTDYLGPALLLASDAGKFVTGQVVTVDGGWSAW